MIISAIGAFVALLAAVLPPLIAHWVALSALKAKETDALQIRSLDELRAGVDRLRAHTEPPVQS